MGANVFQTGGLQFRRNLLRARGPLWIGQVRIEVTSHMKLAPLGPPDDGRNDVLYGRGVVGGDIIAHSVPPLSSRQHLEDYEIWDVEAKRLQG